MSETKKEINIARVIYDAYPSADLLPDFGLHFEEMPIDGEDQLIDAGELVPDNHQVTVKGREIGVRGLEVIPGYHDNAIGGRQDGCALRIDKLHPVVGLAQAALGAAITIRRIDDIDILGCNRSRHEKVPRIDANIGCAGCGRCRGRW